MNFYSSVYGLGIELNKRIPGIVVHESTANLVDVKISLGSMPSWFDRNIADSHTWYISPTPESDAAPPLIVSKLRDGSYYHFHYRDGTEFLVNNLGTEAWGTWPHETLTLEDTATYLLGPIMGFVLLLRGSTSLHASAIAVGDRAIALLGPAGAGKSTTAAAFAGLGYGILAEDVVALEERETTFWVQPGYPCIRLWPTSVAALYGAESHLPKLSSTWDKCYLDLNQGRFEFQDRPLPLAAIYLLSTRSDGPTALSVREMSKAQAFMSLITNSYATNLLDRKMRAREFELLGRVLTKVPVKQVIAHTSPEYIGRSCEIILADFQDLEGKRLSSSERKFRAHV